MRYGLTEQTIQQINSVFEKHPVVKQAVLYGSRAKGNYKTGSDIDLSLFGEDISQSEMNQILDELDALDLPYTMDLTVFRDITHAKFRDHIARVGVVFFQRVEEIHSGESAGSFKRGKRGDVEWAQVDFAKRGWQRKTLRELCQLISGQHIEAKDYNNESRGFGYLTGPSDFGSIYPIISKWTEHPKVKAKAGDILLTVKGSGVGKINLLDQDDVVIGRQLMAIRVEDAEPRFIHAFLSSTFDHFQSLSTGAAIPGISRDQVLGLEIGLPPLPEQQRIVSILDDAFELIDTAISNTEKNLVNARELFESYLNKVFFESGPDWISAKLGDICKVKHGFAFKSEYFQKSGDYILLTPGSFYESGGFRDQGEKTKYYEGPIPEGFILQEGDFLVAMTEQSVGLLGSALVVPESDKYLHNQRLGLVEPTGRFDWSNNFFLHLFKTSSFRNAVQSSASGVKVRHTSPGKLEEIVVKFPENKQSQNRIAAKLDEIETASSNIANTYISKLNLLHDFKQSLLQKVFSGEITVGMHQEALAH
jgi:type I restriction enzyme S subunit